MKKIYVIKIGERFLCKRSPRFGKGWSTIGDTKFIELARKFSIIEKAEEVLCSINFIYKNATVEQITE
jgi:hypothetical protein